MANESENDNLKQEVCGGKSTCPHALEVEKLRKEIKQLSDLVRTDELTGLFNFRYFSQAIGLEMERTRRSEQPTCLIMLDLDYFKSINDDYGHEAGNKVLSFVAGLITRTVRRLDIPCRYGGEEFMIILPDTSLIDGVRFANRLRAIIQVSTISTDQGDLKVTASFGVDVFETGDERSQQGFIQEVDNFLYKAKESGRNRVCNREFVDEQQRVSAEERHALMDLFDNHKVYD